MENIKDLTMYHIHRSNKYDNLWRKKRTIEVDDDFISFRHFELSSVSDKVDLVLSAMIGCKFFGIDIFSLGFDKKTIENVIGDASMIVVERALEDFRRRYYPNLPSRAHSIYVINENGIDYWANRLSCNDSTLFSLSLTGDLFQSNDELLPKSTLNYEEAFDSSEKYWNPNLSTVPRERDEFLFRDTARILRKNGKI